MLLVAEALAVAKARVHIDRVRTLKPYIKGAHVLTLPDGTRLTLSRGRKAGFETALGGRV